MSKTYQVKVKQGCRHGQMHPDYDARRPTGNPGPYALAGEVIEVTQAELDNFGDKFALLDPVSAVLSAPNGATPANVPEPAGVEETAKQRYVSELEAVNVSLQAELAEARSRVLKSEQSAKRARATLKSERKKSQAVEALDKPPNDTAQVKA